ncbi:MAG TPA: TonB-dependent receptor [Candidatus Saccharimonadia bacterium]|nr:TonB-dependent receptor [Candidatus Saccharimonadia bacterium]
MRLKQTLPLAIAALLAAPALPAQDAPQRAGRGHERELEEITVTATPLLDGELVQPAAILGGAELEDRRAATLGETVSRELGVQSSYFGAGVGRPIIRGLEGGRVQVLEAGIGSLDVSTVSADHAVTIEPFLAEQIEVLKGPATLLYGSGAIGGVVNVVDGRIPERANEGAHGRAELRTSTGSDESTGMARADFSSERHALHVDFVSRNTDDYETGGSNDGELLENSAVETTAGAVGYSHFGGYGFAGLSVSRYDTLYGIPGGHVHEEDTDPDESGHEGDEDVRIDAAQNRVDAKLVLDAPFAGAERIVARAAYNEYEHLELEGAEIGTRFDNRAWEVRGELVHAAFGRFTGALGAQLARRDFEAVGAEAFVPPSRTDDAGVFVIEQATAGAFTFELGARYDVVEIETADGRAASFGVSSLSGGAIYELADELDLHLNLDRAQRAPSSEELFSNGAHVATQSFEVGNAALVEETARSAELGIHHDGKRFDARVAAYVTDFADFIYLADTREIDPDAALPVRVWTQADARYTGFEAELEAVLADNAYGKFDARLFGDTIDAELDSGENVPRLAPARVGASIQWARDGWRANIGAIRYAAQRDVAPFEQPTPGYTLVDAHVSHAFDLSNGNEIEVFLDARNLTDRDAHVHTSFLKDEAPLPGRSIALGVRAYW